MQTWANEYNESLLIPDYHDLFKTQMCSRGGGVALFIDISSSYSERSYLNKLASDESCFIELDDINTNKK